MTRPKQERWEIRKNPNRTWTVSVPDARVVVGMRFITDENAELGYVRVLTSTEERFTLDAAGTSWDKGIEKSPPGYGMDGWYFRLDMDTLMCGDWL